MLLKANLYIKVTLTKNVDRDTIANKVLVALGYQVMTEDLIAEDLSEDDAYVEEDRDERGYNRYTFYCNITAYQGCSTWSDPSVGINVATDDDFEVSEKRLLAKLNRDGEIATSVSVKVSNEELVEKAC